VRARFDQAAFALVPSCEDFGGGRAAEDAWVDETGEFDSWDVAGGAVDSFEVPDCFCSGLVWLVPVSCCWEKCFFHLRLGVNLVQESTCRLMSVTWMGEGRRTIFLTSILFREDASETPGMVLKRLHILDVHDQDITRLSGLDLKGSGQVMNLG
jgi:hypothetical protein